MKMRAYFLSVMVVVFSIVLNSCGNSNVDVCRCLTEPGNSKWSIENEDDCRDAISESIGVDNWEKVNMSSNPTVSAKFDALVNKCQ